MKKFAIAVYTYEEVPAEIELEIIEASNELEAIAKKFDAYITDKTIEYLKEMWRDQMLFEIKEIQ